MFVKPSGGERSWDGSITYARNGEVKSKEHCHTPKILKLWDSNCQPLMLKDTHKECAGLLIYNLRDFVVFG